MTNSDGKVKTVLDGSVDGVVESLTLSTSERHVGDGTLVLGVLTLRLERSSVSSRVGSPGNTRNDVGHGAGPAGAENLDGDDVGLLRDTVLGGSDGTLRGEGNQLEGRVGGRKGDEQRRENRDRSSPRPHRSG
jgi:hypothetical protein